ncbi:hypothetical protein Dimus_027541 [Dionaea muscipula]
MMINQQLHQHVVMDGNMSNLTSTASGEASDIISSNERAETGTTLYPPHHQQYLISQQNQAPSQAPAPPKRKRNLPGNPDPDAEVIAMSPKALLATNRFVCEICNKGFQRDQNLQLHRRGHNLPWKLKQRTNKEVRKKVYVCPEPSCVHHDPSRALGDLTGIKKHFCRKHGEKKWKCDKCSKRYAVQSDWKAHSKTCGTKEYRCACGTLFSRRDSFITHRAFCDALAEETSRSITVNPLHLVPTHAAVAGSSSSHLIMNLQPQFNVSNLHHDPLPLKREHHHQQQPQSFDMMMRPDLPPWLSCPLPPSAGPAPVDLSTPAAPPPPQPPMFNRSSAAAARQLEQAFLQAPHGHQSSNPNPRLGSSLTAPYPSPHMSATALLQKAAQMGATMSKSSTQATQYQAHVPAVGSACSSDIATTIAATTPTAAFGLNLSSREEMVSGFLNHGLTSFGNKAAAAAAAAITDIGTAGAAGPHPLSSSSSSSLLHDMMNSLSSATGFHSPSYDDAFGAMMDRKDGAFFYQTHPKTDAQIGGGGEDGGGGGRAGDRGGGNDGLTRDFLGLRPLSRHEILHMAGLGGSMNNNATHGLDHESHESSWQG